MELVEFRFEHLSVFEWRQEDFELYNVAGNEFIQAFSKAETEDCFTVMHEGQILGIGGIIRRTKKTGYAFTAFSKYADTYPITLGRLTRRLFSRLMEDAGYHRITTYNLAEAVFHHTWCEWLGFKREGIVRKFDDAGRDYVQYGMVTHGH